MLRWAALGVVSAVVLVAGACNGSYEEEATQDAGADTSVVETSTADVDVDAPDDASFDALAEASTGDAEEPSDAGADADGSVTPTFCTGRRAALCEDFEDGKSIIPSGWTTMDPLYGGTFKIVEGAASPRAMRMDPTSMSFTLDAGSPGGGPSIARKVIVAGPPASVEVSFRFRIATIRQGARIADVDIGKGQGFHLSVSDGTQGFQLAVYLDTNEGIKQLTSYLIYGGWHSARFVLTTSSSWELRIDDAVKGFGTSDYDVLGSNDMNFRFGSYGAAQYPSPSGLASVEVDDILVLNNEP